MQRHLKVVAVTGGLVVTMPGTQFLIAYRKLVRPPWLSAIDFVDDQMDHSPSGSSLSRRGPPAFSKLVNWDG